MNYEEENALPISISRNLQPSLYLIENDIPGLIHRMTFCKCCGNLIVCEIIKPEPKVEPYCEDSF